MTALNNFLELVDNSLILLDIPFIRWVIIIIVILYNINAFPQINNTIAQWFRWIWVRLFFMLMILYVGFKDRTLALLLGISYVLSIHILNTSRLENNTEVKPYVEPISDIEPDNASSKVVDDANKDTENNKVVDANKVHDNSAYSDYLNSQFDDPLRSFQNLNQCNASNDIAVTDKDKEILENPCSLNKD